MEISTVAGNPKQPLQIIIHNGVSQIFLKAHTIKEKVDWMNALEESKKESNKFESSKIEKQNTETGEKMNETLVTNIFSKFDPLYQKIGKVWSVQAEFEEVMSVMEPQLKQNPSMEENSGRLLKLTNDMKESVAEVLTDLEIARKEFAKALHHFTEMDDPAELEESESYSDEEVKSVHTLRSVKINPKSHHSSEKNIGELDDFSDEEEEKIDTMVKKSSSSKNFDPRELGEDHEVRTQLPAFKDHTRKFSIWGLIRDNIGQDLTRVALPIILNEPVTMLQKCAEAMENHIMLEKAYKEEDPYMRMAYVAAFTTVQYSSITDRTLKPFNPILGETYELVTKDFKYLAEQVSHHPPITASHSYGKGYEYWTHTEMKSKFWGKSLEFTPLGKAYSIIGDQHYVSTRPNTIANNIIFGTLYLDLGGETTTTCPQTGAKCILDHKQRGWTNKNAFKVEGYVYDEHDKKVVEISGTWNNIIKATNLKTKEETVIWEINPKAENYEDQYGLTRFAINLNHFPPSLKDKVAPTDSRYRPDLRLFEEGKIDEGGEEKHRLEEKQREVRKIRKEKGEVWTPLYFEEVVDEDTGDRFFKMNDRYWINRAKGDWAEAPDLF